MYEKLIKSLLHSKILALLFFCKVVSKPAGRKVGSQFDSQLSTDKDNGEVVSAIVDFKGSLTRNFELQVLFMNQCPLGP